MPAAKPRSEWTPEDYRVATEDARRAAYYKAAEARIRKIAENYKFTDEQLSKLAVLLRPGG